MQVFQTIGAPPSMGSTIFATIGWTRNSRNALTNKVDVNSTTKPADAGRTRAVMRTSWTPSAGVETRLVASIE